MTQQRLTPAQRELVSRNAGLAEKISHEFAAKSTLIDIDEVVAVSYQGLINAAMLFDPTRPDIRPGDIENGKAFAGYARQKIVSSILDWQRKVDVLQRTIRSDYKKIIAAGFKSFTMSDRETQELADKAGLRPERVRTVLRSVVESHNAVSTDQHDDESSMWRSPQDVVSTTVVSSIKGGALRAIQDLGGIQQVILAMHYFEGMELQTIASALQMPVASVREIHQEAILTIHQEMVRQAKDG